MAGRAQAANLTGMLNQLAETVGTMGEASDWTHQNIRDYSAPDIKDGSYESLSAYANWAQRNGKQEVADKYRALALAQQQKSKKGAYAQSLAKRRDQIRNLDKGIGALTATIAGMPETTTTMVDAPAPKPDVGGPRRPFQAADNGGFRRPPVAPEAREQIAQEQANPNRAVLNKRLNDMQAELTNRYAALNKFGDENLQFGGLGTEGSEFERTLASEKAAAAKAGTAAAQAAVNLAGSTIDLNEKLGETDFKQQQTLYRNAYDQQFGRVQDLAQLAKAGNPTAVKMLGEAESQLGAIEAEWQTWGDGQTLTGDYTAATYAEKASDDFKAERRAQITQQINIDTLNKTHASRSGVDLYTSTLQEGRTEFNEADFKGQHPETIRIAQNLMEEHRASGERIQIAGRLGKVADITLANAREYAPVRRDIALALKVYDQANSPDTTMTSEEKKGAAAKLTSLVDGYASETAAATEKAMKNVSIDHWYRTFDEESQFWNRTDISDGIDDENRADFNQAVRDAMLVDNKQRIETADEFAYYATLARTAMGFQTDPGVLAGVATAAGNNALKTRTYTEALVDIRDDLKKNNPQFTPDMIEYQSQKIAGKVFRNFDIFFDLGHMNQLQALERPHQPNDPQQMHTLFNNDKKLIDQAVAYMKANPGVILNYNHFLDVTAGE
jgi:hypothetical protein